MRFPVPLRATLPFWIILILIVGIFSAGCTDFPVWDDGSSLRANTTGDLRAYFLDVGQGDSSVILFKDKVILIDAGEIDRGDRVVSDLKKLGVTRIDLLVATHPHSDHIGGMPKVLAAFPVKKVLDSGIPSTSSLYEHFLETVDEENIPYVVAEQGQTIDLDPSLRILVLSPPKERIGDDINTNSIVLRISYGTVNLLYTGDATTAAEDVMVKAGYPLSADVLKVGHHGSSGSSSAAFLRRVDPEVAIISLGEDNEYGHPHRETLERLNAAGPLVLRTDLDGTVLVTSNGATYSVVTEKDSEDIWSQPGTTTATPGITATPVSPVTTVTTKGPVPFTLPTIPSNITVPVPSFTIPSLQVGNASSVHISAVQFNAPGDDTMNLNGEWVRLANRGDDAVLLTSWTLADRNSAEPYRFPAFLLLPGNSVTIYTGSGVLNDTSLFMGRTEPIWGNSGDLATLKDGSGNIIDQRSEAGSS
ncbi:MAG: lamin tail domain-containing protein [Methanoregula sp.]|jgi:competence protein ComEC